MKTTQTSKGEATYEVQYTATQRGRHQLSVAVNGVEIHGSLFAVFVKIPPTQLGTPVQVIEGLNGPYCIAINSDSELIFSERSSHKISVYTRRGEKKHGLKRTTGCCSSIITASTARHTPPRDAVGEGQAPDIDGSLFSPKGLLQDASRSHSSL